MNIYITRENEEYLKSLSGSMSGLVNELLDRHRGGTHIEMGDNIPIQETPKKIAEPNFFYGTPPATATTKIVKFCKHGAYPEFCKHAKPGKPCK